MNFIRGYEPGLASVKDKKSNLFGDSHNFSNRLLLSATECAMG
jgi:hypothetical protein